MGTRSGRTSPRRAVAGNAESRACSAVDGFAGGEHAEPVNFAMLRVLVRARIVESYVMGMASQR